MPELYDNFKSIIAACLKYSPRMKTHYYSSYDHATAGKLYVQVRTNKPELYNTTLRSIHSEVEIPATSTSQRWVTDHLENILIDEEEHTRCHEDLNPTNYPHTFTVPNTPEGRKTAKGFVTYLKKELRPSGQIWGRVIDNFINQMEVKHVGKQNGSPTKCLHFWLEHENEYKPEFGEFQDHVDNPTEIERKYRNWGERTDSLGFLVSMEYMPLYLRDMKNLKKKLDKEGKKFKIDFVSAISQSTLKTIQRWNPEEKFFRKTTALKLPSKFEITEAFQFWNCQKLAEEMF